MKQTINFYDFERAFKAIRPDNFSYEGLRVLFDWFEQMDDDCGTETELDVIAICCEFSEDHIDDVTANYEIDQDPDRHDDRLTEVEEYLQEHTLFVGSLPEQQTVIYQAF